MIQLKHIVTFDKVTGDEIYPHQNVQGNNAGKYMVSLTGKTENQGYQPYTAAEVDGLFEKGVFRTNATIRFKTSAGTSNGFRPLTYKGKLMSELGKKDK